MTEHDFDIGDVITITREPSTWDDTAGGIYPLGGKLNYPISLKIQNIATYLLANKECRYTMKADEYGWALSHLIETNNIELISKENIKCKFFLNIKQNK